GCRGASVCTCGGGSVAAAVSGSARCSCSVATDAGSGAAAASGTVASVTGSGATSLAVPSIVGGGRRRRPPGGRPLVDPSRSSLIRECLLLRLTTAPGAPRQCGACRSPDEGPRSRPTPPATGCRRVLNTYIIAIYSV